MPGRRPKKLFQAKKGALYVCKSLMFKTAKDHGGITKATVAKLAQGYCAAECPCHTHVDGGYSHFAPKTVDVPTLVTYLKTLNGQVKANKNKGEPLPVTVLGLARG
jgi:hypothetical protein